MKTFTITCVLLTVVYIGLFAQSGMTIKSGGQVTVNGNTVITSTVFTCGNPITDDRNGKTYNTVQIGNQCWMKENLNLGTRVNGTANQSNNGIIEKFCYNDIEANCDIYGALYQWGEAMQYSGTEGGQGLCPAGWHVPTTPEFGTLFSSVGGSPGKLKSTSLWSAPNYGATNESGFSGLPCGYYHYEILIFRNMGEDSNFWTSTRFQNMANVFILDYLNNYSGTGFSNDYPMGNPVRCIKN